MIATNVIERVFYLKKGNITGTCFILDFEKKQYFVTAKHVIPDLKKGDIIELCYKNSWKKFGITLAIHASGETDISIFVINEELPLSFNLPAEFKSIIYGQDVYFLGFPYGFRSDIGEANRGFPLPVVKKGILACIFPKDPAGLFLIDGHNNSGFSGGPVVYKNQNSDDFKVAGVVSGYYPEQEAKDDKLVPIKNTNSGLIRAYQIEKAIELIKSDPKGQTIP